VLFGPPQGAIINNLIGCLDAAGHPISCADPGAVTDCDDNPDEAGLPQRQVPTQCHVALAPPMPQLSAPSDSRKPISKASKWLYIASCWLGQEPDVFAPIDDKPSNPEGSTETPNMGKTDPGDEAARDLAKFYNDLVAHAAKAAVCSANVWKWPTKKK